MSEKRMFSKTVVLSDAFLDMPMSARCLYFTLSMFGDDDGFVNSPKAIMRQCGASEDDLKILCTKKFIIPFESGVIVIKHWRLNNYLRSDRYKSTKYTEEKNMLKIEENGAYKLKSQDEIEMGMIEKVEEETYSHSDKKRMYEQEFNEIKSVYSKNRDILLDRGVITSQNININDDSLYTLFIERVNQYGYCNVYEVIRQSVDDDFCQRSNYILNIILSQKVFEILLEKNRESAPEEQKAEPDYPKVCEKCGEKLVDNSCGGKRSWYCKNCKGEYVRENGKWVLRW